MKEFKVEDYGTVTPIIGRYYRDCAGCGNIFQCIGTENCDKNWVMKPVRYKRMGYAEELDGTILFSKGGLWYPAIPIEELKITEKDIATVEALHDILLDMYGVNPSFVTMSNARKLISKMYKIVDQNK